jgi:hypothetical protein
MTTCRRLVCPLSCMEGNPTRPSCSRLRSTAICAYRETGDSGSSGGSAVGVIFVSVSAHRDSRRVPSLFMSAIDSKSGCNELALLLRRTDLCLVEALACTGLTSRAVQMLDNIDGPKACTGSTSRAAQMLDNIDGPEVCLRKRRPDPQKRNSNRTTALKQKGRSG